MASGPSRCLIVGGEEYYDCLCLLEGSGHYLSDSRRTAFRKHHQNLPVHQFKSDPAEKAHH